MSPEQQALWQKINDFELDDPTSEFTFTDRLAKENGWSHHYCIRAIREYKKFIWMCCTGPFPMSPSDPVDQVWHLHLQYTQSYWLELCRDILKKDIHHGPTRGGKEERVKFNDLYAKTLAYYTEMFGKTPPDDIWLDMRKKENHHKFQRINLLKYWLIKKPKFIK
jgi:hypothetical protein